MKFKSDIEIQAGVEAGGSTGSNGQVLSSTGSSVAWINQGDITIGEAETAKSLQVTVKNVSGGELTKGTVVHTAPTENPPSGNVIEVIAADYDDTAKMPAVGILKETIANEAEGEAVMTGTLSGIATDGFSIGDELYVGADGALTNVKPQTAGQLIQKIAVCVKSHASNGLIKIFGAGRSNDVPLPLYIDNANQRLGIGTPNPEAELDVDGVIRSRGGTYVADTDTRTEVGLIIPENYFIYTADGSDYLRRLIGKIGDAIDIGESGTSLTDGINLKPGTTGGYVQIFDNSSVTAKFVNGKVGIGTTDPDTRLEVVGSNALRIHDGTDQGSIFFRGDRDDVYIKESNYQLLFGAPSGMVFELDTNNNNGDFFNVTHRGSSRFYVNGSSGNVGIGTTDPGAKLQVDGGIQMANDTDAASANKVGTMRYRTGTEYVEVTGIDLITNGDFATNTDWITGTDWAIAGGTANAASSTSNPIYQTVSGFTAGNKYRVRFEVTAVTNGYIRVYAYVGASGTFTNVFNSTELEIGFYEGVFEFGGTNKILRFYGSSGGVGGFAGSIDNISVVEVTEEDASYADMCMQTGASTYEWVNIVRNTY